MIYKKTTETKEAAAMTEKVLYTKTVFSGKVLSVSRDAIQRCV